MKTEPKGTETPMTNIFRENMLKHARPGYLFMPLAFISLGCATAPEPEVAVFCDSGTIEISVRNLAEEAARYTIEVELASEGLVESELFSTDLVQPSETFLIQELLPRDERVNCSVTGTQGFE